MRQFQACLDFTSVRAGGTAGTQVDERNTNEARQAPQVATIFAGTVVPPEIYPLHVYCPFHHNMDIV